MLSLLQNLLVEMVLTVQLVLRAGVREVKVNHELSAGFGQDPLTEMIKIAE